MTALEVNIELPTTLNLSLEVPEVPVPKEDDIKSHLINHQYLNAQVTPVMGPLTEGQRVILSLYAATPDGDVLPKTVREGLIGVVRPDLVCPELYQAVLGAQVGDAGAIDIDLPATLGADSAQGKPCTLHYYIQEAFDLDLPNLDDSLPEALGHSSFESLFKFVAEELLESRQVTWNHWVKRQLLYQVMDQVQVDASAVQNLFESEMVAQWEAKEEPHLNALGLDTALLDQAFEVWCETPEIQAEVWTTVKSSLILNALTTKYKLDATKEEILAEVQVGAEVFNQDYEALVGYFQEQGQLPVVANRVTTEKVMNYLMENASLTLNGQPL